MAAVLRQRAPQRGPARRRAWQWCQPHAQRETKVRSLWWWRRCLSTSSPLLSRRIPVQHAGGQGRGRRLPPPPRRSAVGQRAGARAAGRGGARGRGGGGGGVGVGVAATAQQGFRGVGVGGVQALERGREGGESWVCEGGGVTVRPACVLSFSLKHTYTPSLLHSPTHHHTRTTIKKWSNKRSPSPSPPLPPPPLARWRCAHSRLWAVNSSGSKSGREGGAVARCVGSWGETGCEGCLSSKIKTPPHLPPSFLTHPKRIPEQRACRHIGRRDAARVGCAVAGRHGGMRRRLPPFSTPPARLLRATSAEKQEWIVLPPARARGKRCGKRRCKNPGIETKRLAVLFFSLAPSCFRPTPLTPREKKHSRSGTTKRGLNEVKHKKREVPQGREPGARPPDQHTHPPCSLSLSPLPPPPPTHSSKSEIRLMCAKSSSPGDSAGTPGGLAPAGVAKPGVGGAPGRAPPGGSGPPGRP